MLMNNLVELLVPSDTVTSTQDPDLRDAGLQLQHHSPCLLPDPSPGDDTNCTDSLVSDSSLSFRVLTHDTSSGPSPPSSPDITMDLTLESLDSESEQDGIFLDFTQSAHSSRQGVS